MTRSPKLEKLEKCMVCGAGNVSGKHFDVYCCRACAIFFRRRAGTKYVNANCLSVHCDRLLYFCKACRLKKCYEVGMNMEKFQHNRDSTINTISAITKKPTILKKQIPKSFSQFVGRPDLVIFCTPSSSYQKTFINLNTLLYTASRILEQGPESPVVGRSQLEKLSIGYVNSRSLPKGGNIFKVISKKEISRFWEFYFLRAAKWLTYFDEFQRIPHEIKMQLLLCFWHVFGRLDKLSSTAKYRKLKVLGDNDKKRAMAMSNGMIMHLDKTFVDFSWMSNYPVQQIFYFLNSISTWDLQHLIDYLIELDLSDVEMTYIMAQLCFEYAAKRFKESDISKICERFQEVLADDLHSYYVNGKRDPRYSGRLARMMKVNNEIQKDILLNRPRGELASIFNIFSIEFSHPEMFYDTGFVSN